MKRRYLTDLYVDRVNNIKSLMPHCCIGVDIIVGFPGETEEHFLKTYNFLNELDISYLHVLAILNELIPRLLKMGNVIDKGIRHKRSKMLRVLSAKKKDAFTNNKKVVYVPFYLKAKIKTDLCTVYENYIRVKSPFKSEWINNLCQSKLNTIDEDGIYIFESFK